MTDATAVGSIRGAGRSEPAGPPPAEGTTAPGEPAEEARAAPLHRPLPGTPAERESARRIPAMMPGRSRPRPGARTDPADATPAAGGYDAALIAELVGAAGLLPGAAATIGDGAAEWAVEAGRSLLAELSDMAASLPEHAPRPPADTRFTESLAIWAVLSLNGADTLPPRLADEFKALVAGFVDRGATLDYALQCVRTTHAHLTQILFRCCETRFPAHEQAAVMRRVSADMFGGMEVLSSSLGRWFAMEHAGRAEPLARREALVAGVLAGEPVTPDVSARLGYDLGAHHLALVLWCEEHRADCAAELERTASRLLRRAGCTQVLLLPAGTGRLWAWGGRSGDPSRDLCGAGAAHETASHLHAAAGLPAGGAAGFRLSHTQALDAERVARQAGAGIGVFHDYAELDLVVLLRDDLGATAAFVRRELGPLADDDKNTAMLRGTVKRYLDHERSLAATAASLHVAKNTVVYRLKKAEQLLGRPFRVEGRKLRLHVALHMVEALGPAVLGAPGRQDAPPAADWSGRAVFPGNVGLVDQCPPPVHPIE